MKHWHRNIYLAFVLLFFVPCWPILYMLGKDSKKNYSRIVRLRRFIASLASFFSGFTYKITYKEPIDWGRNYIICANHTSNLDITAVIKTCPIDFSFIGKEDLLNNPVTGFFFRTIDIPVNRTSKISSFRAFKKAHEYLDSGKSIVIFPEGGIADDYPPRLQPFKSGGFKLAVELNIPILPIVIENAWNIYWDDAKVYGSKPGRINVKVLKPIDPLTFNGNPDGLRDRTFELFRAQLNETE